MGLIFISHSSKNNDRAIAVRDWLRDKGWRETFLDLDPEAGLVPGQRWQEELKKAGENCSAVILLISPAWLKSDWCRVEFLVAAQLGKRIFGVIVAKCGRAKLLDEIRVNHQLVDVSDPAGAEEGFERLRVGLKRAGLDPDDFPWPPAGEPDRSAYRGLRTLEEPDAAVFFGRDGAITRGLDTLRRMRDGAPERMLVILGASGAGKSSFLRAGLLARLQRDEEQFLVLPTVRPERLVLTGPRGVRNALGGPLDPTPEAITVRLAAIRKPSVNRLQRYATAAGEVYQSKPPTLVLPIDQAEELFDAENQERIAALDLIRTALDIDPGVLVVATIRSDSYARLQAEARLAGVPRSPFDLPAMPLAAFKDVIEGPGRLTRPAIAFEPELTDRLVADLDRADALPLLAFTLAHLVAARRQGERIALVDYERGLGGLDGAIGSAVDAAFAAAGADPALPRERLALEALARQAFIPWLVRLDEVDAAPKRRVAIMREIPVEARALVRHFIDHRLLLSDARGEEIAVEVSHEAVLRRWESLSGWIDAERDQLRAVESVRAAAAEWQRRESPAEAQSDTWLVHRGVRLAEALRLLERKDYAPILTEQQRAYLARCEDRQRREQEEADQRAREREARAGAAMARAALQEHPQRALLLAMEAVERLGARQEGRIADVDEALTMIVRAVQGQPVPLTPGLDPVKGVNELRLSPDGRYLARLHMDTLLVWPLDAGGLAGDVMTHAVPRLGQYARLRWVGARDLVAEGEAGGAPIALIIGVTGERALVERAREAGRLIGAAPEGTLLVVRAAESSLLVSVRADAVQHVAELPPHRSNGDVVFSPDGSRFVMCDHEGGAIYRIEGTGETVAVRIESRVVADLTYRFSPNNRWLFSSNTSPGSGGSGAHQSIWDLSVPAEPKNWRAWGGRSVAIAEFSPDSQWLAFVGWNSSYQDEYIQLFRLGSAETPPHRLRQIEEINHLAFSHDSHWIVSASNRDDNAFAWDLQVLGGVQPDCAERAISPIPLGGHGRGVNVVSFARSDTTIVTLGRDGVLRQFELERQTAKRGSALEIWRLAPSSPTTLLGHDRPIASWVVSANEQSLLTAAEGETPRLWRLPARDAAMPADIVADARRLAARAPSEEERARYGLRE